MDDRRKRLIAMVALYGQSGTSKRTGLTTEAITNQVYARKSISSKADKAYKDLSPVEKKRVDRASFLLEDMTPAQIRQMMDFRKYQVEDEDETPKNVMRRKNIRSLTSSKRWVSVQGELGELKQDLETRARFKELTTS